jgi:hypothetical protein
VYGIRAALRQSPNVVLVGEIGIWRPSQIALTAAENRTVWYCLLCIRLALQKPLTAYRCLPAQSTATNPFAVVHGIKGGNFSAIDSNNNGGLLPAF